MKRICGEYHMVLFPVKKGDDIEILQTKAQELVEDVLDLWRTAGSPEGELMIEIASRSDYVSGPKRENFSPESLDQMESS